MATFTIRVVLFMLLSAWACNNAVAQQQRPNILWIVSEDNNAAMIGCYGNSFATTPNIDKLATEGVRFKNAFATAPVCAPSRCSIITGMYPPSLGTEHMRSTYQIPEYVKFFPRYLREAGYYTTNNSKKDYNTIDQLRAWDESSDQATYKNRRAGQPFFSVFNLFVSHESSIHKRQDSLRHDPAAVPIPPYHPSTKEIRDDWAQYYDKVETMDQMLGKLLKELDDQGLTDNTIVFYYADNGGVLPRSKRFLYESGLHIPLIVRVPDQYRQQFMTVPGSVSDRLVTFLDLAPTVLTIAGVEVPDHLDGKSIFETGPGSDVRYAYGFRGRMDERIDLSRTVRDKKYRYIRNYLPHLPYGQRLHYLWLAESTRSWEQEFIAGRLDSAQSAFWKEKPAEELFDVDADPDNVHNLAGKPGYDSILFRMRKANHDWLLQSFDIGFIPEAILYDFSQTGVSLMLHPPKPKEHERIIETAEMASMRDAKYDKQLLQRLKDADPSVRYWAAIGCSVLANKMKIAKGSLETMLGDKEGAVQVAAAEALYHLGEKQRGYDGLIAGLKHANPFVRVQAINVLQSLGSEGAKALESVRALIPVTESASPTESRYDVVAARTFVESFEPH